MSYTPEQYKERFGEQKDCDCKKTYEDLLVAAHGVLRCSALIGKEDSSGLFFIEKLREAVEKAEQFT